MSILNNLSNNITSNIENIISSNLENILDNVVNGVVNNVDNSYLNNNSTLSSSLYNSINSSNFRPMVFTFPIRRVNSNPENEEKKNIQLTFNPNESVLSKENYLNYDKLKEDKLDCPICLDIINSEVIVTNCDHRFCYDCLLTHLRNNNKCPMCRTELRIDEIFIP